MSIRRVLSAALNRLTRGRVVKRRCWEPLRMEKRPTTMRPMLSPALLIATAGLVAGCTASNHVPSTPSVPTSFPTINAVGSVSGIDEACDGPVGLRTRRATVHLLQHGSVVATSSVIAGNAAHDRYRLDVAPGHYLVRASNWPRSARVITVRNGASVQVDFLNDCQ
jgi:hypothetical protein